MNKGKFALFSMLEITYWAFHASFVAYASAYLISRGVSNTAMSLLISGFMLCAFAGSMIFGRICDRLQSNKRVFIPCMLAAYALMFAIYAFGDRLPVLAVCYPLLGLVFQPQGANADAWVLSAYDHDQKMFGRVRSMPSLFYAVIGMVMGRLISRFGYRMMLFGGTLFMALCVISAAALPDARAVSAPSRAMKAGDVRRLFCSRPYRMLVILLFLIGLSIAPINNLKIVVLENVGGNVSHIGVDSFVSALTQVPFIAMAGLLMMIPLRARFVSMALLPLGMILLVRFASSPAMVFAGSFLANVGFGILLPTMRDVTERYVDGDLRNLGHNLSDAVYNSFSSVISLMYAGAVADRFGVSAMLTLCAVIAVIPAVLSMKKLES
ncbi:MAG: MFS transporter [Clostridia bacterium]|nr:MFS transporter [Clostridia bacterium]